MNYNIHFYFIGKETRQLVLTVVTGQKNMEWKKVTIKLANCVRFYPLLSRLSRYMDCYDRS